MRVCLIAPEIFGYGLYGGIGAAAMTIATGLAERGIDTVLVVPRATGQPEQEIINGVRTLTYDEDAYAPISAVERFEQLFTSVDADIYHSIEPSPATGIAMAAAPGRKHIITFQAPAELSDWQLIWQGKSISRESGERFFRRYMGDIRPAVNRADLLACQAKSAIGKCRKLYALNHDPEWLPNPVHINTGIARKSVSPRVCFLGRWDPVKRPALFLELAKLFSEVTFIAMGQGNEEFRNYDQTLRNAYAGVGNLEMAGLMLGREKTGILEKSWVLVNTSIIECMPVSFLEAASEGCAILSHVDADGFASRFGCHVKTDSVIAYRRGLEWLLEEKRCLALGKKAYKEVREYYALDEVIQRHIDVYQRLLPTANRAIRIGGM